MGLDSCYGIPFELVGRSGILSGGARGDYCNGNEERKDGIGRADNLDRIYGRGDRRVGYEEPLSDGALEFQADFEWSDDRHFQIENNPALAQDAYGTVNVRATYRSGGDRRFSFALFADNVFDEEYFTNTFDVSVFAGGYVYSIGDPRTYGAELTYNW